MLWTIFIILIALWLLGLIGGIGGQFIHLLLLVAGAVLIYNIIRNRLQAF
jgi:hypothetical protein